jgi:hypothetical protein
VRQVVFTASIHLPPVIDSGGEVADDFVVGVGQIVGFVRVGEEVKQFQVCVGILVSMSAGPGADIRRVFEPKTKRRKPLKTLSFGNFGGFRKYKVQKTSPSLI